MAATSLLPGEAAGLWRPATGHLPHEHDAAEVVGVVGRGTFELLTDGHVAGGMAGRGGTHDELLEAEESRATPASFSLEAKKRAQS